MALVVAFAAANWAMPVGAQVTTTYSYDSHGQLKTVSRPADSLTYRYDAAGNRVGLDLSYPPPTAAAASLSVPFAGSASLALPVAGQVTSIAFDTTPTKGTLSLGGTTVAYFASGSNFGADSFTYHAVGPGGNSAVQTVSVTIGNPPAPSVANTSLTSAYNGTGSVVLPVSGVYTSIGFPSGSPAHGVLGLSGVTVTYVAASGYYGADSFTYNATGPGGTSPAATVAVTVATPAAPTVGAVSANVASGTATAIALAPSGAYSSLALASAPAHGSASISGTTATYTPASSYAGADSFTYTATGPGGASAAATVSVTVTPNHSPVTADDSVIVAGGDTAAVNVLANDSDPDGDTLTLTGISVTNTIRASYYIDGPYIYVTGGTKTGQDTVTYTVSDGHGGTATGTLRASISRPQ